jgi:pyruvate dehydrogenase E2 component (dihydrolipoamide acetyltransferase)/2-oxoglutarate dehydrogenase E2 component (dihydrolipoamide succinyltransferase)
MAVADATIIEWKVKEGDKVDKGQIIAVVETEKVRSDVESPDSGFIRILAAEGTTAPVGMVIAQLAATREELARLQKQPASAPAAAKPVEAAAPAAQAPVAAAAPTPVRGADEKVKITPVARKMAEEHAIDVTRVAGTGPGGRITREDVEKAIAEKAAAPKVAAPVPAAPGAGGRRVKSTMPLRGMRKTIADHMLKSLSVSAQLTRMGEIDMTEVVKLRKSLVDQESVIGTRITYTDIFVMAIAKALKIHPEVNASIIDNEIKVWEDVNVGVAVALDEGLIVPVVKNADKKTLAEISKEVKNLAEKARSSKLVADEITGGTFTVSNVGAVGGGYSYETPIINQPESAILLTGAITDRVVAKDGQICVRPILTYSFTYDHRLLDGAVAARFMAGLIRLLENPSLPLA